MTLSVKETDIKRHKIPNSVNYEGTLISWDGCFNVNVCGQPALVFLTGHGVQFRLIEVSSKFEKFCGKNSETKQKK